MKLNWHYFPVNIYRNKHEDRYEKLAKNEYVWQLILLKSKAFFSVTFTC